MTKRVCLKEATMFHGHLGPYLILGILTGDLALKKLKCKKYFGLKIRVFHIFVEEGVATSSFRYW